MSEPTKDTWTSVVAAHDEHEFYRIEGWLLKRDEAIAMARQYCHDRVAVLEQFIARTSSSDRQMEYGCELYDLRAIESLKDGDLLVLHVSIAHVE